MTLRCSRATVVRKFLFLSECARKKNERRMNERAQSVEIQFDDLETFEHSKMKPLSVILAVENYSRFILGFGVAKMPSKGVLTHRAKKKYGVRVDERTSVREDLFRRISGKVAPSGVLWSDQNPHYVPTVRKFFATCTHKTTPGRRGCVVGQGELKSGGFDPLFSLNHTCAMLRANLNRLVRRTWCTTKDPDNLARHIEIYVDFHNTKLLVA